MTVSVAISPCPNDTFLFGGWVQNFIDSPFKAACHYYDIHKLNQLAQTDQFTLCKLSCFGFFDCMKNRYLLPVGAAIGQFGPKLIAKTPIALSKIDTLSVAIPGGKTTANLLLHGLVGKPKKVIEYRYDTIVDAVASGNVDAGVIIHETRFTFKEKKLLELCDLGDLFFQKYRLPITLGVLAINKTASNQTVMAIIKTLRSSYSFAKANTKQLLDYIQAKSDEKDPFIIQAHIDAFVNDETYSISKQGIASIKMLHEMALSCGYIDKELDSEAFYFCNA